MFAVFVENGDFAHEKTPSPPQENQGFPAHVGNFETQRHHRFVQEKTQEFMSSGHLLLYTAYLIPLFVENLVRVRKL
jgi:hypothetical protein